MKKKKIISFGLLAAAFVFFCNPNVNIFDVLPDALACLLVVAAISKVADLYGELGEAKEAFIKLFFVNIAKLPALLLVIWMTGSNMDEDTMWLTAAFVFAVLEVVFSIIAFKKLFNGLAYLGTREDGGEFLYLRTVREPSVKKSGRQRKGKYKRIESLERFTVVFLIVKAACCTLPEISQLYTHDSLGYVTPTGRALIDFRSDFIFIGIIVALLFGVIWVVKMFRYVDFIIKPKAFWERVSQSYEERVLPRKGLFTIRRVHVFSILLMFAVFFSVDMYFDDINYMPDFISAIFFFAAAYAIGDEAGNTIMLKISSAVYFVLSAVTFITMLGFRSDYFSPQFDSYRYASVRKISRAGELYNIYFISNILTMVAFVITMISVAVLTMRIVKRHTGFNTLTGVSNRTLPIVKVYGTKIKIMTVGALLAAISSIAYMWLVVDVVAVPLRTGGVIYQPRYTGVWMADFAVQMIFAVFTMVLLFDLTDEVRYKYKYE